MTVAGAKTFKNFIGGEWVEADSGETFETTAERRAKAAA